MTRLMLIIFHIKFILACTLNSYLTSILISFLTIYLSPKATLSLTIYLTMYLSPKATLSLTIYLTMYLSPKATFGTVVRGDSIPRQLHLAVRVFGTVFRVKDPRASIPSQVSQSLLLCLGVQQCSL
jgi:hypothetical protein